MDDSKEQKLSKVGEWLRSDEPPFWDFSDLSEKEMKSLMRRVMK